MVLILILTLKTIFQLILTNKKIFNETIYYNFINII